MKSFILALFVIIFVTAVAKAESFQCESDNKKWKAIFTLEESSLTELVIERYGQQHAYYLNVKGETTQMGARTYYEFSLGGAKYFDFDKKQDDQKFEVQYLPRHNPFRPEILMSCELI